MNCCNFFDDDMLLLPACKNIGEFVKDGTCTCPPGQIAQDGACRGMYYVFSQIVGFFWRIGTT